MACVYSMAKREEIINHCKSIIDSGKRLSLAEEVQLVQCFCVSFPKDKLEDITAITSSMYDNKRCEGRCGIDRSVCSVCYVPRILGFKPNVRDSYELNTRILSWFDISEKAWATLAIPTVNGNCRFESHGDTVNQTHAENLIKIAKTHKGIHFSPWSKNFMDWIPAFEKLGKPKNMQFVWSCLMIDHVNLAPKRLMPYVDHVFTVFNKKTAKELGLTINCGVYDANYNKIDHKCKNCGRCYHGIYKKPRKGSKAWLEYKAMIEKLGLPYMGHDFYIFELKK